MACAKDDEPELPLRQVSERSSHLKDGLPARASFRSWPEADLAS